MTALWFTGQTPVFGNGAHAITDEER